MGSADPLPQPLNPRTDPRMNRPLRILHTEAAKGMGGQEIYIFRHMQVMR
ncbi:glycosyltransferase family 1 protein, partial [Stenotrophomonas sp. 2YAF22]